MGIFLELILSSYSYLEDEQAKPLENGFQKSYKKKKYNVVKLLIVNIYFPYKIFFL